ncbi:MAG: hypothetical protein JWP79_877, partial [Polaromonas sp.]|nr:hypothetical protein [Polaromonas sp.]
MKNTFFANFLPTVSSLSLASLLLLGPATSAWAQQIFRCAGV